MVRLPATLQREVNPVQIIAQKRDGRALTDGQIAAFISGYVQGEIADYQMAALAMAIFLRGMAPEETACLTEQMLRSGRTLCWPGGSPPKVDKHSTGGVGDKTSLVLAPLLACCGVQVPMISGRALGTTGGTLDKLESIPGFRTNLSIEEIQQITGRVGCVITGATDEIAPADRKLYALRDVTATVASTPLITASILSKKLAEGLDALVLDVKVGSGALMKSQGDARALADSLVATAHRMGLRASALLTDMNQPLGRMVGNAVEVDESIEALKGHGPEDLTQLVVELASDLLVLVGQVPSRQQGRLLAIEQIRSGRALEKFRQMVEAQGGDLHGPRPVAPAAEIPADRSGYVSTINTEQLGQAVVELGGGRRVAAEPIDHGVGLEMMVRLGDPVRAGDPLVRLFARPGAADRGARLVRDAISITDRAEAAGPLIFERIEPA